MSGPSTHDLFRREHLFALEDGLYDGKKRQVKVYVSGAGKKYVNLRIKRWEEIEIERLTLVSDHQFLYMLEFEREFLIISETENVQVIEHMIQEMIRMHRFRTSIYCLNIENEYGFNLGKSFTYNMAVRMLNPNEYEEKTQAEGQNDLLVVEAIKKLSKIKNIGKIESIGQWIIALFYECDPRGEEQYRKERSLQPVFIFIQCLYRLQYRYEDIIILVDMLEMYMRGEVCEKCVTNRFGLMLESNMTVERLKYNVILESMMKDLPIEFKNVQAIEKEEGCTPVELFEERDKINSVMSRIGILEIFDHLDIASTLNVFEHSTYVSAFNYKERKHIPYLSSLIREVKIPEEQKDWFSYFWVLWYLHLYYYKFHITECYQKCKDHKIEGHYQNVVMKHMEWLAYYQDVQNTKYGKLLILMRQFYQRGNFSEIDYFFEKKKISRELIKSKFLGHNRIGDESKGGFYLFTELLLENF